MRRRATLDSVTSVGKLVPREPRGEKELSIDLDIQEYMKKLDKAASAPDSSYPSLLWEPLLNDFGDAYLYADLEDSQNVAVRVDPRFTRANIRRIAHHPKTAAQWLASVNLYDAYSEYLIDKYGSLEAAHELLLMGEMHDPPLDVPSRPTMKKCPEARLIKNGIIPCFRMSGITEDTVRDRMMELMELCEDEVDTDGEEPDVDKELQREMSEHEKDLYQDVMAQYRQLDRVNRLMNGTSYSGSGIMSGTDWVSYYYDAMSRGDYNVDRSRGAEDADSLVATMRRLEDERFTPEELKEFIKKLDGKEKPRLYFDGWNVSSREDQSTLELYKALAEVGVDWLGVAGSMGKQSRKVIRAEMEAAGIATQGLTEKEYKKMEKKRRKNVERERRMAASSRSLEEILRSNRIMMNGGTQRLRDSWEE